MWRELVRPASLARHLNMAGAGVLSQAARDTLLALVDAQFRVRAAAPSVVADVRRAVRPRTS